MTRPTGAWLRLPCLLLAAGLLATGCSRTLLTGAPATRRPSRVPPPIVEVAYIGPAGSPRAGPAAAFALGLKLAAGPGGGAVRVEIRQVDSACGATSLERAALTAGADPAVVAAAVYDCGNTDGPAVGMLQSLRLPAVFWGRGLRAVLPAAASVSQPSAPTFSPGSGSLSATGLGAAVAAFDAGTGLRTLACLDDGRAASVAACGQVTAAAATAGLDVTLIASLPTPGRGRRIPPAALAVLGRLAAHPPAAIWYAGTAPEAAAWLSQWRNRGIRSVLEVGGSLVTAALAQAAGRLPGAEAIGFVPPAAPTGPAPTDSFAAAYAAAGLQGRPGQEGIEAAAAATVLYDVIRRAGTGRRSVAAGLAHDVSGLATPAGPVTLGPAGRAAQPRWTVDVLRGGVWSPWTAAGGLGAPPLLPPPPAGGHSGSGPTTVSGSTYGG